MIGPAPLAYDASLGVQTGPLSEIADIRLAAGGTNYDFDVAGLVNNLPSGVSLDGSYATFFAIEDSPANLWAVTEGGTSAQVPVSDGN